MFSRTFKSALLTLVETTLRIAVLVKVAFLVFGRHRSA